MKGLIILILFTITISAYGQVDEEFVIKNYYNLTKRVNSWKPIIEKKDSLQLTIINKVVKDTSNHFYLSEANSYISNKAYISARESLFSEFHFIDIDGDNDLDLYYQGMKGAAFESTLVLIFINNNGNYQKSIDSPGRIVHLEKNKQIILYQYPCCGMITNTLVSYSIKSDEITEAYSLRFFNSPILHSNSLGNNTEYENIMPKKLRKGLNYEIICGVEINLVPQDTILYPTYIDENLIGKTKVDIVVTEYGKQLDDKGETWLYCKIPNEAISSSNCVTKYASKDIKLFGWVYLKNCCQQ